MLHRQTSLRLVQFLEYQLEMRVSPRESPTHCIAHCTYVLTSPTLLPRALLRRKTTLVSFQGGPAARGRLDPRAETIHSSVLPTSCLLRDGCTRYQVLSPQPPFLSSSLPPQTRPKPPRSASSPTPTPRLAHRARARATTSKLPQMAPARSHPLHPCAVHTTRPWFRRSHKPHRNSHSAL